MVVTIVVAVLIALILGYAFRGKENKAIKEVGKEEKKIEQEIKSKL